MKILYKTITGDLQVADQECWLVGIELSHTTNASMIVYDESDSTKTAAKKVSTIRCTSYTRENTIMFPEKGIHCEGIYVDYSEGIGTIYYHY